MNATPPLRIAYVITDLEIGGVPLHLLRLASAVQARGHDVRVLALGGAGPVAAMLEQAGVPVEVCGARSSLDVRLWWRLVRRLRRYRPDLVHSLLFHANIAVRLAGPLAGLRPRQIICEIQTVEVQRRWHLVVDRWTQRLCRVEVGNSPSVIKHLQENGIAARRLVLVPGGIDVARFVHAAPAERSTLGIPARAPLLCWVGRLDPIKGLGDLLDALALMRREMDVHLLLVGAGPLKAQLEQHARASGVGGAVRFLGARHDVPALLRAADVFVFPSYAEGLPNALMEAMAAGCAIVCTDAPGNRDLVTDGSTGLLCPPRQAAALAESTLRFLRDREFAVQIGKNAQNKATRDFSQNAMVDRYLRLYDSLSYP